MIESKKCPNCKNILYKDELCPFCGRGKLNFQDEMEFETYTRSLKSYEEIPEAEIIKGEGYSLTLYNGRLYGIGDNSRGQISSEAVGSYDDYYLISENVLKAVAGKGYTVYLTEDGSVKIVGNGKLADAFPGFSGAIDIFATSDGQFIIASEDGFFYGFGNNEEAKTEELRRTELFRKENIPFRASYDPYFTHGFIVRERNEKGHLRSRYWTHDDTVNYWKSNYFSNALYCGEEVYERYNQLLSEYGSENISWDINLDFEESEPFKNGEICLQEFTGKSDIVIYKKNDYIYAPVRLETEKIKSLLAGFEIFAYPKTKFTDNTDEMRLFACMKKSWDFLVLDKGRLFGRGNNSCGHFGDRKGYGFILIDKDVVSAAISPEYTIYVTASGEVKMLGNGEYVDRLPAIGNAKQVFITEDNKFFIVTKDDVIYAFGNNEDYTLQKERKVLLESGFEPCVTGPLYPATNQSPFSGLQNFISLDNKFSKQFEHYYKEYGRNNITRRIATESFKVNFDGTYPYSVSGNFDYKIFKENKIIFKPVLLSGKHLKNAIDFIDRQLISWDSSVDEVRKSIVETEEDENGNETVKNGVILLKDGRLKVWTKKNGWEKSKLAFKDICDVGMRVDDNSYETEIIITQKDKKILFREVSDIVKLDEALDFALRVLIEHRIKKEYYHDLTLEE